MLWPQDHAQWSPCSKIELHAAGGAGSLDEMFARMSAGPGGRGQVVASEDGGLGRVDDEPGDSLLRGAAAQSGFLDAKPGWKRGFK